MPHGSSHPHTPDTLRARGGGSPEQDVPGESLLLTAHPSVTATARRFVTGWAARHHLPAEVTDTLELLTSEVVGNAVVHGLGPVRLTIGSPSRPADGHGSRSLLDDGVLVQVHDASTDPLRVRPLTPDLTGGRGLAMVELLARRWGVSPPGDPSGASAVARTAPGKTVWFVLGA